MENFPDISRHLHFEEGFCYPDWVAVGDFIHSAVHDTQLNAAWEHAAKTWLTLNAKNLSSDYQIHSTENFLLLTAAPMRVAKDACLYNEYALTEIMRLLDGVASDEGYGKHVAIMFSNDIEYYRYISYFYPDGEHPGSSGMCIHSGYNHLVFPSQDHSMYRTVSVHELTHICLGHLPIPLWVNEALAMTMEEVVCGSAVFDLDREKYDKHTRYWTPQSIQQFWSGESWRISVEANELSYNLAQVLWRKIETDLSASREEIVKFVGSAHWDDGGESSFQRVFDLSLGALVEDFLGEGDWSPKPHRWPKESGEDSSTDS